MFMAFFLSLGLQVLHDLVTPARGGFEAFAIENPDPTAAVADQFAFLESAGDQTDSDPLHTEHVRQKFLREEELV
jgi:hypothetical protein